MPAGEHAENAPLRPKTLQPGCELVPADQRMNATSACLQPGCSTGTGGTAHSCSGRTLGFCQLEMQGRILQSCWSFTVMARGGECMIGTGGLPVPRGTSLCRNFGGSIGSTGMSWGANVMATVATQEGAHVTARGCTTRRCEQGSTDCTTAGRAYKPAGRHACQVPQCCCRHDRCCTAESGHDGLNHLWQRCHRWVGPQSPLSAAQTVQRRLLYGRRKLLQLHAKTLSIALKI